MHSYPAGGLQDYRDHGKDFVPLRRKSSSVPATLSFLPLKYQVRAGRWKSFAKCVLSKSCLHLQILGKWNVKTESLIGGTTFCTTEKIGANCNKRSPLLLRHPLVAYLRMSKKSDNKAKPFTDFGNFLS